jgi:hypothetical protein
MIMASCRVLSRVLAVISLVLGLLVLPAVAAAGAAPTLAWGPVQTPDPYRGGISAVDCLSATWCMAVDDSGQAIRYAAGRWYPPVRVEPSYPLRGFRSVSCARRTVCFAVDQEGRVARWNGASWSTPALLARDAPVQEVSCAGRSFCLAVGDAVARWNGSTWRVGTGPLPGVDRYEVSLSCAGPHLCMAVARHGVKGHVDAYKYRDGTWTHSARFGTAAGISVSCPSRTFCAAVDSSDHARFWNGSRWHRASTPILDTINWSIACTSRTRCLMLSEATNAHSQSVEWNGHGWGQPRTFGTGALIYGLSCVGRDLTCLAVDQLGGAMWHKNHRWLTRTEHDPVWGQPTSLACGTAHCLLLDRPGAFIETAGSGWTKPRRVFAHGDTSYHSAFALSCSSDTFCLASTVAGQTRRWNGRTWTTTARPPLDRGDELSCASRTWCAEISSFTGAMAVFDGTRWHRRPSLGATPQTWALSCGAPGNCVAASNGVVRVYRHGAWSKAHRLPGATTNSGQDVSCTSATFCMVLADYGQTWRWDGRAWHLVPINDFPMAISCTSPSFCAELDYDGVQVWDGTAWTPSTTLHQPEGTAYGLIACASPRLCVVGSWTNEVRIGRGAS